MRLDPLNNEWVVIAAHRQGRIFLPPKELNPLAPSRPGFLTEIPESDYEVVVFDNRSPSLRPPEGAFDAPHDPHFSTPPVPAAGKCEVVCFTSNYDSSFKDLSHAQIRTVLEAWRDRTHEQHQASAQFLAEGKSRHKSDHEDDSKSRQLLRLDFQMAQYVE